MFSFIKHQKTIDFLKLDVEFSEWPAILDMIKSGVLNKVRQLAVETHSPEMDIHIAPEHPCTFSTTESMQLMLKVKPLNFVNIKFTFFEINRIYLLTFSKNFCVYSNFQQCFIIFNVYFHYTFYR